MLKVSGINKCYKKKEVLKEVEFSLGKGEICGLLGKNGAGKSTLNKIILNLVIPDSGFVTFTEEEHIKQNIGYLSENITLYQHLNAYQNLTLFSMMAGVKLSQERKNEILEIVNLPRNKKVVDGFSMGMKRRLQLALTLLIKDFPFLILDEPTNGLDLEGMLWFKSYMKECKKKGQTILVASHAIAEIQEILTDYMILHQGKILEKKQISEIETEQKTIRIELEEFYFSKMELLCRENNVPYKVQEKTILLESTLTYAKLNALLEQYNIQVASLSYKKANLEHHFLTTIRNNKE